MVSSFQNFRSSILPASNLPAVISVNEQRPDWRGSAEKIVEILLAKLSPEGKYYSTALSAMRLICGFCGEEMQVPKYIML